MKLLLILMMSLLTLNAKKDFYYSYINDDKKQLNQSQKSKILSTNEKIIYLNKQIDNGDKNNDAYKQIILLKANNKIDILNSSIALLYAKALYIKNEKKYSVEASFFLEDAINKSIINQSDLLDALKLLVNINIKLNKIKVARYYAQTIYDTFEDDISKAYSKILFSKIDIKKRNYKRAIKVLYKILIKTKDIKIATIVADELFDAYILNKQYDKAKLLTKKVLDKNLQYYSSNSYLALIKIDKLLKVNMPHLAIKILKGLLKNAKLTKDINNFKLKLANTYMTIFTKKDTYLLKAKELYKDLVRQKRNSQYKKQAKMYLDEILMRQNIIKPQIITKKYPNSTIMYNRSLFQELLNYKNENEYDKVQKLKNVYLKIPKTTARRFGYNNVKEVFDEINSNMIKKYLNNHNCKLLDKQIIKLPDSSIMKLIEDKKSYNQIFECMLEYPNKKTFSIAKKVFLPKKNLDIYFKLEKIALMLNLNKDALELSLFIDKSDDKKLKSDEFLYRFLIYSRQNNSYSMDKFFSYTKNNKEFIKNNENNPKIIDFYYQYYLYLIKNNKNDKAITILQKLYDKQNEMDAHIYSPFVQMQLAQNEVLDDNYENAIIYLKQALETTRKINDNDLVKIYYNMANYYKKLNKTNRYKDAILKCKSVKNATTLYKSMCDKL